MGLTFFETWRDTDMEVQNIWLEDLRYKGKTRLDGVAPTIIKVDFTSADQNEFERHQKCIRVGDIYIKILE